MISFERIFHSERFKNETMLSERSLYLFASSFTIILASFHALLPIQKSIPHRMQFICCSYCELRVTCGGKCRSRRSVFRIEVMGRSGAHATLLRRLVLRIANGIDHGRTRASPIRSAEWNFIIWKPF